MTILDRINEDKEKITRRLLQEFTEKLGVRPPFNMVGFIKNFMKEETLVEVEFAEKSKLDHLEENDCIEGDFRELE